jgi:hypothetical protein
MGSLEGQNLADLGIFLHLIKRLEVLQSHIVHSLPGSILLDPLMRVKRGGKHLKLERTGGLTGILLFFLRQDGVMHTELMDRLHQVPQRHIFRQTPHDSLPELSENRARLHFLLGYHGDLHHIKDHAAVVFVDAQVLLHLFSISESLGECSDHVVLSIGHLGLQSS